MDTETPRAIPWYKSKIIVGVMVSLLCKVLVASGLVGEVSSAAQQQVLEALMTVLGGVGDMWAIWQRLKQTSAPAIAVSKAHAAQKHADSVLVEAMMQPTPAPATEPVSEPAIVQDTPAALAVPLAIPGLIDTRSMT